MSPAFSTLALVSFNSCFGLWVVQTQAVGWLEYRMLTRSYAAALESTIRAALVNGDGTGALPIQPLIAVVAEYAAFDGAVSVVASQIRGSGIALDTSVQTDPALIVSDYHASVYRRISLVFNTSAVWVGTEGVVRAATDRARDGFIFPHAICADPVRPGWFWVGDQRTVRTVDPNGATCIIAGHYDAFDNPPFEGITGIVCARDGESVYATDRHRQKIFRVSAVSDTIEVVAGSGKPDNEDGIGTSASFHYPREAVWASHEPDEKELIVAASQRLFRLNVKTRAAFSIQLYKPPDTGGTGPGNHDADAKAEPLDRWKLSPSTLCLAPCGRYILFVCSQTSSLWVVDLTNGHLERLAGVSVMRKTSFPPAPVRGLPLRFGATGMCFGSAQDQCVYLAAEGAQVLRVTVPGLLYESPAALQNPPPRMTLYQRFMSLF